MEMLTREIAAHLVSEVYFSEPKFAAILLLSSSVLPAISAAQSVNKNGGFEFLSFYSKTFQEASLSSGFAEPLRTRWFLEVIRFADCSCW